MEFCTLAKTSEHMLLLNGVSAPNTFALPLFIYYFLIELIAAAPDKRAFIVLAAPFPFVVVGST
jgi:hypothetical protein